MSKLHIFRAIPRPLGQYLAIGLLWPLWTVLGVIEAIVPKSGAVVQRSIEGGLAAIPEAGWAAIAGILIAGHWSRTVDKKTEAQAAETLVEAARIAEGRADAE